MATLQQIDVHGIRLYANHGCMQEEAIIGSHYEVNISVWANLLIPRDESNHLFSSKAHVKRILIIES